MTSEIRRVLIVGGTHGNEWTGIYLANKFQQQPDLVQRQSFTTITLLANPQAVAINRRYIDRDLNRCFDRQDLANPDLNGYEDVLAKEIAARWGESGVEPVDAIIDLHSTTANMGATIIPISPELPNLRLAAYLHDRDPSIHIHLGLHSGQNSAVLRSMALLGCTIEVGAIPQGVLDARLLQQTERLIMAALDYFEAVNQGIAWVPPAPTPLYQAVTALDYPRNSQNELQAMIHPDRQGQDYQPVTPGDPLFMDFSGQTIQYVGERTLFPVFINEAAYYEKGIAMVMTEKQEFQIT